MLKQVGKGSFCLLVTNIISRDPTGESPSEKLVPFQAQGDPKVTLFHHFFTITLKKWSFWMKKKLRALICSTDSDFLYR